MVVSPTLPIAKGEQAIGEVSDEYFESLESNFCQVAPN
jgi:hypothetical protein